MIKKIMKKRLAVCIAMGTTLATASSTADVINKEQSQLEANLTTVQPEHMSIDKYAGYYYNGKVIADLPQVINQIWTGYLNSANGGKITYNFPKGNGLTGLYNNPKYGFTAGEGLSGFSESQKESTRESIQLWDDIIAPSFIERGSKGADIQFANSDDPGQAYAYYPEYGFTKAKGWKFFGDVFVATPAINWTNNWLGFGGYGATTVIHEIGHTLGLSHPGAYNGSGATTYADQAEYAQDSTQYAIMSYWGDQETSNQPFAFGIVDWSTGFYNNAQTPLVHDVLAAHQAYGADPTTRADDTTYGWNSTAGRDVFDFTKNYFPYLTIYDAGGNDTLDMSGANASVFIDLESGSFSSGAASVPSDDVINARRQAIADAGASVGPVTPGTSAFWQDLTTSAHEGFLAIETGVSGLGVTSHDNISIAYGTIIENAIGSSERDYLKGNQVANVLTGNGGDDVLNGFAGADTYNGGEGADTFVFSNIESGDVIADFTTGEDVIDLIATGVSFTFVNDTEFSNLAGELRFADGVLSGDVDGDGLADLSIDLNGAVLSGGDLIL
ncbi:M10 family metallopeptidase C-terminal domain-containing protein [Thalassotalea castellviae]|uniref:M10 family metallopeptidase C-terminal domain-containing protein n=1 Tax=Thalassotalea castellviae TaxID=3075612 RepID=A0ABU3A429_9GAMM|nr:M10 family metallopeptidase C-terminal domain-containing protein [Thalassotalea sp. W431]MDT0604924.1 M10 family metallopeptidase C-terminal domain-containing protein [Thalassotalea sp. W431]